MALPVLGALTGCAPEKRTVEEKRSAHAHGEQCETHAQCAPPPREANPAQKPPEKLQELVDHGLLLEGNLSEVLALLQENYDHCLTCRNGFTKAVDLTNRRLEPELLPLAAEILINGPDKVIVGSFSKPGEILREEIGDEGRGLRVVARKKIGNANVSLISFLDYDPETGRFKVPEDQIVVENGKSYCVDAFRVLVRFDPTAPELLRQFIGATFSAVLDKDGKVESVALLNPMNDRGEAKLTTADRPLKANFAPFDCHMCHAPGHESFSDLHLDSFRRKQEHLDLYSPEATREFLGYIRSKTPDAELGAERTKRASQLLADPQLHHVQLLPFGLPEAIFARKAELADCCTVLKGYEQKPEVSVDERVARLTDGARMGSIAAKVETAIPARPGSLGTVYRYRDLHSHAGMMEDGSWTMIGDYQLEVLRDMQRRGIRDVFVENSRDEIPAGSTTPLERMLPELRRVFDNERLAPEQARPLVAKLFANEQPNAKMMIVRRYLAANYGAAGVYAAINSEVALHATIDADNWAQIAPVLAEYFSRPGPCDPKNCTAFVLRQSILCERIADFERRNPGRPVGVTWGAAHDINEQDFARYLSVRETAPELIEIYFPGVLLEANGRENSSQAEVLRYSAAISDERDAEIQFRLIEHAPQIDFPVFSSILTEEGQLVFLSKMTQFVSASVEVSPEENKAFLLKAARSEVVKKKILELFELGKAHE